MKNSSSCRLALKICIGITMIAVAIVLWYLFLVNVKRGFTNTFGELPRFGTSLSVLDDKAIEYKYVPDVQKLLTRTRCTTGVFFNVCTKLGLQMILYERGFPGPDLLINDSHFEPKGSRVWCGYGRLRSDGRAQVRVFFEPPLDQSTNTCGILYLHVQ